MDLGDTVSLPPNFVPLSSEDGDNAIRDPSKVYIKPLAQLEFPSLDIPKVAESRGPNTLVTQCDFTNNMMSIWGRGRHA